jgi:predicted DNA-binding WGR domain protein
MTGAVVLRRVDEARNMARFYRLDVQPDLFGGCSFIREWGRIGSSGTVRVLHFSSEAEALAALERQRSLKERRGYLSGAAGEKNSPAQASEFSNGPAEQTTPLERVHPV